MNGLGLAAFRALFGALMVLATARFVAKGWVRELYVAPSFHFTYPGFHWVRPWPAWAMYVHFFVMGSAALFLMLGLYSRLAALVFFLTFTYVELLDKAAYLNHYYFVSLISALLIFAPASEVISLDVARLRKPPRSVPALWYWLFRAQLTIVYFFAGFAKLNEDWLFRAEPLRTWLYPHSNLPLVGSLLGLPLVAYLMSWFGAIYDLTIAGFLLWRRSRAFAVAAAAVFHTGVWLLFPIGVFSWVMLVSITLFLRPEWPEGLLRRGRAREGEAYIPCEHRLSAWMAGACVAYLSIEALFPLRFIFYPGPILWTEEGFRFSWRVMLIEKTGSVEFVAFHGGGGPLRVDPRQELTALQYKMMSTQPDMIHQYAIHIAETLGDAGYGNVRVHVRAWASLNGRAGQELIDPNVDLAKEPETLGSCSWIRRLKPDKGELASPTGS